jgi:metal-responsive CopG/Arc/MetJ family transcriptional regulator
VAYALWSVFIGVRVPDDLADRFALAARVNGRTRSAAVREAMRAYVDVVAAENDDGPGASGPTVETEPKQAAGHARA